MNAPKGQIRLLFATIGLLAAGLAPRGLGIAENVRDSLRNQGLNSADYEQMEASYYERMIGARRLDAPLAAHAPQAPFDAGVLALNVNDVREYVLKPGLVATHKGVPWHTNSRGLRDREYSETRPPNAFRVALVGDSIAAGWGVDDELDFESILECRWSARAQQESDEVVEIWNFAVPGHAPGQRWEHFSRVGWDTQPDLVLIEATLADLGWDERRLRALLPRGLGFDARVYCEALAAAGINSGQALNSEVLKSRLRPQREAILRGVYQRVVVDCRAHSVQVVWILLPRVGKKSDPGERAQLIRIARAAGFDRIIDISETFDGLPATHLAIAPDDFHPNAEGHVRLAERLDAALAEFVSAAVNASRKPVRERPRAMFEPEPANRISATPECGASTR
jgi:lysophospholipase L1-like esterase